MLSYANALSVLIQIASSYWRLEEAPTDYSLLSDYF